MIESICFLNLLIDFILLTCYSVFMKEGELLEIGDKIKKYRKQQGLTQKDLAARLNTTPQNLAQYENKKRNPKPETLQRIADALNISMQYLLPDTDYNQLLGDKAAAAYSVILEQIIGLNGYAFGITEDTDSLYISYPDGILEITPDTADKLQDDIQFYVDFKMQQLKKEHIKNFIPQKFFNYSTQTAVSGYRKQQSDTPADPTPQEEQTTKDPDNIVTVDLTPNAAHARTDVEQTPEGLQHDLDIMNDDKNWE